MAAVKDFLNINQFPAEGIYYKSAEEIIASVQNDPYAVGFCKMVDIINPDMQGMVENIRLLPVDKNGNGKIDHMEKIFDNLDAFARGVWIGKYPRSLYRDVYVVSLAQPENESETAFLKWILSDGQQFLSMSGLSNLVYGERQSKLDKFNEINVIQPTSKAFYFLTPLVFIILASLILLSLVISVVAYYRKNRKISAMAVERAIPLHFTGNTVNIPKGLYYDKTHTWAFMEKDGMVKMGIDDFLQHVTGPITRIQMRKAGEKIRKGDMVLTIIQNGKRLIVFAPVSGTIFENNKILAENSSLINSSPYADGWVYRIEPTNWLREIQFLDMAEKYKTWLNNEFTRLKDFLAVSIKVDKSEYENVVLQDGGILKDNILEEFGPEVWEDFQVHFMDPKN
jgi:glycine cleavage system H lipoate-binding protein